MSSALLMKFITVLAAVSLLVASIDAKTWLLPIPQSLEWTGSEIPLDKNFDIHAPDNAQAQEAANRYKQLILKEKWVPYQKNITEITPLKKGGVLKSLQIGIKDLNIALDFGIDESYNLTIPETGGDATLDANTWVGALRGLETFSQLFVKTDGQLVAHSSVIQDWPTYPHRGIMLDTARNFYKVESILRTIDALAYNKMNVLHWHLTDSQSWPLGLDKHPELAEKGAYSAEQIYSVKDLKKVVSYGQSRGVRVIPEIDMPAHTASIAKSHPDLVACIDTNWLVNAAEPAPGALDPTNNQTYSLIADIVGELSEIFPDSFYHAGGDEVSSHCWKQDKKISKYLKKHEMTTNELWSQFEDKVGTIVNNNKKRIMIWEDAIVKAQADLNKDVAVQIWTTTPEKVIKRGHDIIHSSSDYFYLDCGGGGWVQNDTSYVTHNQSATEGVSQNYGGAGGSWCAPYKTWQRIYSFDMTYGITSNPSDGQVLGGEAALWSEQSDDTDVDAKLWPRGSAAAEIFWSGSYDQEGNRRSLDDMWPRINDWRYRLVHRGIAAIALVPEWCLSAGTGCLITQ